MITIIGVAMGGVTLSLMITVVLCIVILCMRRSYRKWTFPVDAKVLYNTTELNENVTIENNPSYDHVVKLNRVNNSTIKPVRGSDVPITTNPSYDVHTKPYSKTSEDEYSYVQSNKFFHHSDLDGTIKMDTDPAYGVSTGEEKATAFSTTVTNSATTKQYNYDYFLHYNTSATTTDAAKDDYLQIHANGGQCNSAKPVGDGEYGPVLSISQTTDY